MNTEEDTFWALRKRPASDMDAIKEVWLRNLHDRRQWDLVLTQNGWTRSEWEAYLVLPNRHANRR